MGGASEFEKQFLVCPPRAEARAHFQAGLPAIRGGERAATYVSWARSSACRVEFDRLQPPGEGPAWPKALPHTQMESLIAQLLGVFAQVNEQAVCAFRATVLRQPLFGFWLALQCQRRGLPLPACFIASGSRVRRSCVNGRRPYTIFRKRSSSPSCANWPATPEEVLTNGELIELLLPLLRRISGSPTCTAPHRPAYNLSDWLFWPARRITR